VAVILITHKIKLNPDNLATPLAASIGDVVALSLLAFISSFLFEIIGKKHYKLPVTNATSILDFFFFFSDTHLWVTFVVVAVYFILLPFWTLLVWYNRYTRTVLTSGWVPILSALFISG
jgi:solute carrier family 41